MKFDTPEQGFSALTDYIERACTGKHKAYSPNMSIKRFFEIYAPDGQVITTNYATFVCNYMSTKLGETIFPSKKLFELV